MGFCPKTKEYLLHDNPSGEAQAHLEVCEHCRTEFARWQEVRSSIQEWDPAPGHSVTQNEKTVSLLNAAVRRESSIANKPTRLVIAAAMAASIALIIAAIGLLNDFETTKKENPRVELIPITLSTVLSRSANVSNVADSAVKVISTQDDGQLIVDLESDRFGLDSSSNALISRSSSGEIRVTLIRGTLVVQAKKRPQDQNLVVEAADTKIFVTGTQFSVGLSPNSEVQVTVSEGTVRIVSAAEENLVLRAGDTYRAVSHRGTVTRVSTEDRNRISALLFPKSQSRDSDGKRSIPDDKNAASAVHPSQSETGHRQNSQSDTIARARSLILKGENEKASAVLKKLLVQAPDNVEAWMLLATSWRKMGKWVEAASAFDEAANHGNPAESNRARFMSAVVYQDKLGNQARAKALLGKYLRSDPGAKPLEPKALLRLVRAEVALGDLLSAKRTFNELKIRYAGTKEAEQAAELIELN